MLRCKTELQLSQRTFRVAGDRFVLCGTDIVPETIPAFAADTTLLLRAEKQWTGLFYVLTGANTFGAALLTSAADSFEDTLKPLKGVWSRRCW